MRLFDSKLVKATEIFYVPQGSATSEVIDLFDRVIASAILSGTIAATSFSFEATEDGTNWNQVYDVDSQSLYVVNITASKKLPIKIANFFGCSKVRIILNSAQVTGQAKIELTGIKI